MQWIFLSPHFDDVALSCGGMVWEQRQLGHAVEIWTICGGEPPPGPLSLFAQSLHARWEVGAEAVQERRQEDLVSCQALGATQTVFDIPDCIYRPGGESEAYYYTTEDALFGPLDEREQGLVDELAGWIKARLPEDAQLVSPLTLGGHADHRLTRAAAERLGRDLWYYADYPYVVRSENPFQEVIRLGWKSQVFPISKAGLRAWQDSIAAYQSQLSTFWADLASMRKAIEEYCLGETGVRLWRPPAA